MQRLHFPPGSAYRSETGGLMKALRALTIEQSKHINLCRRQSLTSLVYSVRHYHGSYYVPHNLTLIVAGKLASGIKTLLNVVQDKIEPTLVAHGQNQGPRPKGWVRPFLETPSARRIPFNKTITEVVEFPEKDESVGELQISWQGPPTNSYLEQKVRSCLYFLERQNILPDAPGCLGYRSPR